MRSRETKGNGTLISVNHQITDGSFLAERWPPSAKLVIGKCWQDGIHCHDCRLRELRTEYEYDRPQNPAAVPRAQQNLYAKSIRLGEADVLNDGLHLQGSDLRETDDCHRRESRFPRGPRRRRTETTAVEARVPVAVIPETPFLETRLRSRARGRRRPVWRR